MNVAKWVLTGYLIIGVAYGAVVLGSDPTPMPALLVHGVLAGLLWPFFLLQITFVYLFCIWPGNTCS
jgi:hypothetical protein